jgi:hypothetical protein
MGLGIQQLKKNELLVAAVVRGTGASILFLKQ